MDNLAHSLVGAALAETGLRRWSPHATATLVVGANLPDLDALAMFAGNDTALLFRRDWTHGVLAQALLPLVLAGLVLGFDRLRHRSHPEREPARALPLVALAYVAVLSHPLLDWLNTYGVRLLMPFDGRWFYGDALFIVDPWIWLLLASAVVLARTHSKPGLATWIVLGCATTALVLGRAELGFPAKLVWIAGLAAIVVARLRAPGEPRIRRVAIASLSVLALYVAFMVASSNVTERHVRAFFERHRAGPVVDVMAGPLPANPFRRDVLVVTPEHYLFVEFDLLSGTIEQQPGTEIANGHARDPVVLAALNAPSVRGLVNWMRYPAYEVESLEGGGFRVSIRDLRYARARARGFAAATVELDAQLRPRARTED